MTTTNEELSVPPGSGVDCKYGWVEVERQRFHPEEPVFVLRAQDRTSIPAMEAYLKLCCDLNCPKDHLNGVSIAIEMFRRWQVMNFGLTKLPG